MTDKISTYVNKDEFSNLILELISSEEINKYIDYAIFKDNDTYRLAVIYGLALSVMLISKCDNHYDSVSTEGKKQEVVQYTVDEINKRNKIRRRLAVELIDNIHNDIGYQLGGYDPTNGKFSPSDQCIRYIMDALHKYEVELEFINKGGNNNE